MQEQDKIYWKVTTFVCIISFSPDIAINFITPFNWFMDTNRSFEMSLIELDNELYCSVHYCVTCVFC